MTQPAPSLDSFFAGGSGGKSVSWKGKDIGTSVSGIIAAVHPPQQVTDPVDNKPKFNKNGQPVMQVRIDLDTDLHNWELCKRPDDPNEIDDGRRSVYAGVWMAGAIGDATRKAGHQGPPEVGAKLTITLVERTPNDNPALNPTNKFSAVYESPSAAATGQFFGGEPVTQQVLGTPAPAAPEPQRPPTIPEASWAAMPLATRQQVASSLAGIDEPPF